jgi:class 3 adenylate cyclase
LRTLKRLDEPTALAIMADVARGLAVAHDRGIVHRDIKPENILLIEAETDLMNGSPDGEADTVEAPPPGSRPRVKLSDFGVARQVDQSESLSLTQAGSILGTPLYMAPEQCAGSETVGPAADVYALGATLFHMLAGRPPFEAASTLGLIAKHQNEPPPSLRDRNESVSEAVDQVVAKALAKRPEQRYADAGEMLLDLERLLRGEPTGIGVHPKLPDCEPGSLVQFDFRWELQSEARQLWPHVSNTERLNRALGLPAIPFTTEYDPVDGVRRYGEIKTAGLAMKWREQPYEWVEGRRMGVVREFSGGPFRWFVSMVELTPRAGGGTTLTHSIRVAAQGWLGRVVAHLKIGRGARRAMDRVYRRIDAALRGNLDIDAGPDPFEPPAALSHDRRRRLERWLDSLGRHGVDPLAIERIGDYLALASPQDVARIRPLALARRLDLDADQVLAACLHGANEGAMILLWDILCPVCRIPSQVVDTLRALREHGRCESCHVDFELDFANSVEMIFRVHPEIRESETGVYCIGGPAHSPHVVAQVRIGPGERFVLDLELTEGAYRLRGPQLSFSIDFRVEPAAPVKRWDLTLSQEPDSDLPRTLRAGGQTIALTNDYDRELLIRIERTAPRDDALTAAQASALALFRELFPGEVLSPGQLINLAIVTLLVAEFVHGDKLYQDVGDARAFALIQEHLGRLDAVLRRHGGAAVKTVDERTVAVFSEPLSAVQAGIDLASVLVEEDPIRGQNMRVGIHRGPALVATREGHLDYFGTTPRVAARLSELAPSGAVVLSPAVAADPGVSSLLQSDDLTATIIPAAVPGLPEGYVHRISHAGTAAVPGDD